MIGRLNLHCTLARVSIEPLHDHELPGYRVTRDQWCGAAVALGVSDVSDVSEASSAIW